MAYGKNEKQNLNSRELVELFSQAFGMVRQRERESLEENEESGEGNLDKIIQRFKDLKNGDGRSFNDFAHEFYPKESDNLPEEETINKTESNLDDLINRINEGNEVREDELSKNRLQFDNSFMVNVEANGSIHITVVVAGRSDSDINVEVENQTLYIKADVREELQPLVEPLELSFELGNEHDPETVNASYENGILEVTVSERQNIGKRKIDVN